MNGGGEQYRRLLRGWGSTNSQDSGIQKLMASAIATLGKDGRLRVFNHQRKASVKVRRLVLLKTTTFVIFIMEQ